MSFLYSVGWSMLLTALKLLLNSEVLAIIRDGVLEMMEVDKRGMDKHEIVVEMAQAVDEEVSRRARPLAKELFDIAVKAVFLEVTRGQ